MLEVDERNIIVHRGDTGVLSYDIDLSETEKYQFKKGDKVELRIFEEKGYNKRYINSKIVNIEAPCTQISIELDARDTSIGISSNKELIYWYDIYLNGNVTNGYDEDEGPSQFIILPAKGVEKS